MEAHNEKLSPMQRHGAPSQAVVVGIDVGGLAKGLHAVALQADRYRARSATTDIIQLVYWCESTLLSARVGSLPGVRYSSPVYPHGRGTG